MLSDFNCKILDIDRYKFYLGDETILSIEAQKLVDDINLLGSCGFHKLIHQIKTDPTSPYYVYKNAAAEIIRRVKKESVNKLSGKYSFYTVPVLCLNEDTPFIKGLESFTALNDNYIFFELPPADDLTDQLFVSLNYLLYQRRIIPAFTNIQAYLNTYSVSDINRIINIKGAAFQFSLDYISISQHINTIKYILNNGGLILLGSSSEHSTLNITEINKSLMHLKKHLGNNEYMNLIFRSRSLI